VTPQRLVDDQSIDEQPRPAGFADELVGDAGRGVLDMRRHPPGDLAIQFRDKLQCVLTARPGIGFEGLGQALGRGNLKVSRIESGVIGSGGEPHAGHAFAVAGPGRPDLYRHGISLTSGRP
jgi:hypothetical protein